MIFGRHPFMRDEDTRLDPHAKLVAMMQRKLRGDVDFSEECLSDLSPGWVGWLKGMEGVEVAELIGGLKVVGDENSWG